MKKKARKLSRYLRLYNKRLRKIANTEFSVWLRRHIKAHPFIFGLILFVWASAVLQFFFERRPALDTGISLFKFHAWLLLGWILLTGISNALKDQKKARWFFRKKFVFAMLIFLAPLGLILLWSGANFKRITKIVLTIIFATLFISGRIYEEKRSFRLLRMSTFDRIVQMLGHERHTSFLKVVAPDMLKDFKASRLEGKKKAKLAVSDIYSRYAKSIVFITTKGKTGRELGQASGFVISQDGIFVTNAHVLRKAYRAEAKIGERLYTDVLLVKVIPQWDLALLKVEAADLNALPIGDSDALISGQFVVALGNPLGLEQSVSSGIISAIRASGQIKLIQITAPLSPGSSGGPLLNEYGEVVGITTLASFLLAQNINFAIPINYLEKALTSK